LCVCVCVCVCVWGGGGRRSLSGTTIKEEHGTKAQRAFFLLFPSVCLSVFLLCLSLTIFFSLLHLVPGRNQAVAEEAEACGGGAGGLSETSPRFINTNRYLNSFPSFTERKTKKMEKKVKKKKKKKKKKKQKKKKVKPITVLACTLVLAGAMTF